MILLFSNTKTVFKVSFFLLPDDCSLDLKTLQQQQSQDPFLRTVSSLLTRNDLEFPTHLITDTPFLHANYKRFSQFFIGDPASLISLYTTSTIFPATNQTSSPNIIRNTIRIRPSSVLNVSKCL